MVIFPSLFGTLHSHERQRRKSGFLAFAAGRLLGFASLRGFFGFLEISGRWRTLITRLAHFFAAAVGNAFMLGLDVGVKTGFLFTGGHCVSKWLRRHRQNNFTGLQAIAVRRLANVDVGLAPCLVQSPRVMDCWDNRVLLVCHGQEPKRHKPYGVSNKQEWLPQEAPLVEGRAFARASHPR